MSPVSQYFILNNSEYWSQKHTQNGNIHSTKLDVYVEKQSGLNPSFILSQHKQGRKYYTLASYPLTARQNWYNTEIRPNLTYSVSRDLVTGLAVPKASHLYKLKHH